MNYSREKYDKKIQAKDLKVGDKIHLTFMGGDEYLDIDEVKIHEMQGEEDLYPGGKGLGFKASNIAAGISDCVPMNHEVWIKK